MIQRLNTFFMNLLKARSGSVRLRSRPSSRPSTYRKAPYIRSLHHRLRQSIRLVCATYMQDCCVIGRAPEGCRIGAVMAVAPGLAGGGVYTTCGGWYCGTRSTGGGGNVWAVAAVAHRIAGIISSFRMMLSVAMPGESAPTQHCTRNCMAVIS